MSVPREVGPVVAVVVTRNRLDLLLRAIDSVAAQSLPVEHTFIVDNGSADGTQDAVRHLAGTTLIEMGDNTGYAAGLAAGMEPALERGAGAVWMLDDDSQPGPTALGRLVAVASADSSLGLVGLDGGTIRRGRIRHGDRGECLELPGTVHRCDFVLVDGALAVASAIRAVGPPRADFFMMLEDIELSWRVRQGGFGVAVLDDDLIHRDHAGSAMAMGAPWRRYYQSRNHVRWALDSRSPEVVLGAALRQLAFLRSAAVHPVRQRHHLAAQLRGLRSAWRGEMGRTLEPGPPGVLGSGS